jgi:hypothetical protein
VFKNIRMLLAALGVSLLIVMPAVSVAAENVFDDICAQPGASDSAVCEPDGGDPITGPDGIIARVTNVLAVIAGILAVVIIIWGGFTYVTSAGDANKATNARNMIIYAAIGLVVIVLAQTLIIFILNSIV